MKSIKWITGLIVVVILMGCGVSEGEMINSVKNGSFHTYRETTLGEGFDDFFQDGDWEYAGEGHEGSHTVYFDGIARDTRTEENVSIRFIFEVREGDRSFRLKQAYIGNQSLAPQEIDEVISAIFEE